VYYLDNAATSYPKPPSVVRAAVDAMHCGNPGRGGHRLAVRGEEILYRVREKAAAFFGASPERVVFTQNATHALNVALAGVQGEVVTGDMEHNAVRRPLLNNRRVRRRMAKVEDEDEKTLADFRALLSPCTALCCVTAQSNVTGQRLPIAEIAQMCRKYNIPFVVDASQAAGTMDLQVDRDGISMLCTAGHKGLYGMMGSGLLILGEGVCPAPFLYGGSGGDSQAVGMPDLPPERLEAGTQNVPAIASLGAGLDFVTRQGREAIAERERRLAQSVYDELCEVGPIKFYGRPQSGTLLLNIEGIPSHEVAMRLDEAGIAVRAGLHCAPDAHQKLGTVPDGGVRVSFGAFNGWESAEKIEKELKKIAKSVSFLKNL